MRIINLLFHDIIENQLPRNKYAITKSSFLSIIKLIVDHSEFSFYEESSNTTHVRIFIDDGYASTYATAFPVLEEFNIKPYIAITANTINQEGYISIDQIKELHKNGWTICSHGVSHVGLSIYVDSIAQKNPRDGIYHDVGVRGQNILLTQQEVLYQLVESKRIIGEILNCPVESFVYPYGIYNKFILNTIKNLAIYKKAYTCDFGAENEVTDPVKIPRLIIDNETSHTKIIEDLALLTHT